MKLLTNILSETVGKAFAACGYKYDFGKVNLSNRPDLCAFQCNGAFSAAKDYHKAPMAIAGEVVVFLKENEMFANLSAVGGFINIDLSDSFLLEYTSAVLADKNLGIPQSVDNETIMLDYGGPNVAKPLHIGHLRSAVIGQALKNIVRASGRKAIGDVHLGDWGLQIGLVIAELLARNISVEAAKTLTAEALNEIYPFASTKSKEDEAFKATAQQITAALQSGDELYTAYWQEIIRVSVADLKQNYKKLNVDFELWYGESDSEKYVESLLAQLSEKGLLRESNGAMVVDVAEDGDNAPMPPVIIKKSDHSNIYATTDLATIIQRQRDYAPSQLWYVVDSRQALHFTQVFRCAKKAGLVPETTVLEHLGFGTMNGSDGKPYKTRDGGVMKLSDFYQTVYDAALARTEGSAFDTSTDKAEIASKLAVATIKFGDLINHRTKDYVFDLDKFLASEGKTGAFLLYTVARINSILKKASPCAFTQKTIYSAVERDLIMKLALSNNAFVVAFNEKAPNYICENAYQLASAFSKFYHDNHILSENDSQKQSAWLAICVAVKQMLLKHLDVLGIESVENM